MDKVLMFKKTKLDRNVFFWLIQLIKYLIHSMAKVIIGHNTMSDAKGKVTTV